MLPAPVAGDAERLARFQREAEVLAALNHPNIAAIYGLEKTADVTALVMELVEGDDLSQRITRGAIAIDEALHIAKQIADALEAAHEQGDPPSRSETREHSETVVDLPEPFGPSSPRIAPGSSVKLTSRIAGTEA